MTNLDIDRSVKFRYYSKMEIIANEYEDLNFVISYDIIKIFLKIS